MTPMDQGNAQGTSLLQQGIAAARAKRKAEAYQLLRQVVAVDPRNMDAWIWLGAVAPTLPEQLQSFERALALDPTNEKAQAGRRWAASRLGAGAPAPPPAAPSPGEGAAAGGGRISSQEMLGMFGGVPGGSVAGPPATPPGGTSAPAAGGISSQDMLGMFGGVPAPAAPSAPPAPASGGMSSQDMLSMFGGPASAPTPTPPAPAPAASFGASPMQGLAPPATMPPGAPGTPGGSEWRGFSELEGHEPQFNWDDPGLDLGGPAAADSGDQTAARPYTPGDRVDTYPAPAPPALPAPPYPDATAYEIQQLPAAPLDQESGSGARIAAGQQRMTRTMILVALVVIILLLLVSVLLGTHPFQPGAAPGPETTVNNFLAQHLKQQYDQAAPYLAPALRDQYAPPAQNLPGLPLSDNPDMKWTVKLVPLANDQGRADVDSYLTPTVPPGSSFPPGAIGPVRFALAAAPGSNTWTITGITLPGP